VDGEGQIVPPGVAGELWIAGSGLARGYWGKADTTAERFVTAHFGGLTLRCYRTGDVARRLADGRVEVLGRLDHQIKLRGFRIELGEIEEAMMHIDDVASAAVTLQEEQSRLVAYYVERPGATLSADALREKLAQVLPDYMVPAVWMRLEALPLNANGKLDRRALPSPVAAAPAAVPSYEPPRNELQRKIAAIWQEVLGVPKIGLKDNLLDLGADSIHLFQIAARSLRAGLAVSAGMLLRHPTVEALATAVGHVGVEVRPIDAPSAGPSLAEFRRTRRRVTVVEALGNSD
jgi:aryl carrier-like protein